MIEELFTATVVGLAAGLSSTPHCAAMCGPLSAAVCSRSTQAAAPLRYQLGRLMGYALLGVLAGQLGHALGSLQLGPNARWGFRALIAVSCLFLAYGLWGRGRVQLVPARLRPSHRAGPRSSPIQRVLGLLPRDVLGLGALSALLPCGALYTALLLAAGSGDARAGAALMFGFALASGLPLIASGAALRLRALRPGRRGARLLATLLVFVAAFALVQPLLAAPSGPVAADAPAPCH